MAQSATGAMGDWSPVGSQQITRQRQFVLPSHYRLYVGRSDTAPATGDKQDLSLTVSTELARYLRRYFVEVEVAEQSQSLAAALKAAAASGADILMLPRVDSWPTIEPIGRNDCPSSTSADGQTETKTNSSKCIDTGETQQGEMVLSVAIYDVQGRQQIDVVSAQGRRGAMAYLVEKKQEDLQALCNAIASQMSAQGRAE